MKSNNPMITKIPISKARVKLGELTNKVFKKEHVYILSKSGLPIAAIINMEEFERLGLVRLNELNDLGKGLGKEAGKKNITEEELEKMMEETRAQVYKKSYGK